MGGPNGIDCLREFLKIVGFNKYKTEAYIALFKLGTAKVSEISKESGVPQAKLYSILEDMEKEGLIKQQISGNKQYTLIHPGVALDKLIQKEKNRLQSLISLKPVIVQLFDRLSSSDDSKEFLEIIRGRDNVLTFLAHELEYNTHASYWTLGSLTSTYTPVMPIIRKRRDELDIKIIAPVSTAKPFLVRKYISLGAKVRLLKNLESPIRFSIYDNSRLAFTLTDAHKGYLTLWTNSRGFVENLSNFFEFYWENGIEPNI